MNFSEKKEHPFTKPVTIQKFSVKIKGTPATSLQIDVLNALKKTDVIDISKDIHVKCRKHEEIDNKLLLFFSWYDDLLDVSTTKKDANDVITSESVNNADICHLFLSINQNIVWAFSTLNSLHLEGRLSKTLWNLLNNRSLDVCPEPDLDMINTIKKEGIKYVGVEGNFDLLALGFNKTNFFSMFEPEESKTEKKQIHSGTLTIDKKGNPKIIKKMEENPALALDYMTNDEYVSDKNIYIQTSKQKIDGSKLKKKNILYLTPIGKTKTVSWTDAKEVLLSI